MPAPTGSVAHFTRARNTRRRAALVWIDSREAIVVHWSDGHPDVMHVESDVPTHHRSTRHVRHDPAIRHGGGGPQEADEPRRLEHLVRFMSTVEAGLLGEDDLFLMGPGVVHEHLAERLRERDRRYGATRTIRCETAARLTDRQLVARLRAGIGAAPRRGLRPAHAGQRDRERVAAISAPNDDDRTEG